jgi:glucose/arabinose dehydrogenase
VASGLESPLWLTAPPGDPRLFVVEQPGRIRVIKDGRVLERPFLDITGEVLWGGERGLLSVAFHPRFAENGRFYVNYTSRPDGDTRVERYLTLPGADTADASSAATVLEVEQPFPNHNGGQVMFGPDGMLWIGMGDGGAAGDPFGHAQNRNTLLGDLLRIDVDSAEPYSVPAGNPYAGQRGRRGEIWAYGLRNPWRFAFDRVTGLLYIADVGQDKWEEINVAPADSLAINYGWNRMEGKHCYGSLGCAPRGTLLPVVEYGHDQGCSITGGFVYRGTRLPELAGHYFYSDYCAGWLRSFKYENSAVVDHRTWDVPNVGPILSFGEDATGELYVLSGHGAVYRIGRARFRPDEP